MSCPTGQPRPAQKNSLYLKLEKVQKRITIGAKSQIITSIILFQKFLGGYGGKVCFGDMLSVKRATNVPHIIVMIAPLHVKSVGLVAFFALR